MLVQLLIAVSDKKKAAFLLIVPRITPLICIFVTQCIHVLSVSCLCSTQSCIFICYKQQNKISQNEEKIEKKYPQREEYQWRPAPILCKRFDIIDPFMGKVPQCNLFNCTLPVNLRRFVFLVPA